jgi:hypothetical protein
VAAAAELARERQVREAREDELRTKIAELRGAAAALQVLLPRGATRPADGVVVPPPPPPLTLPPTECPTGA